MGCCTCCREGVEKAGCVTVWVGTTHCADAKYCAPLLQDDNIDSECA